MAFAFGLPCRSTKGQVPPKSPPPIRYPDPPPMPQVRDALIHIADAKLALERNVWSVTQLRDVIRSAEYFIELAKNSIDKPKEKE